MYNQTFRHHGNKTFNKEWVAHIHNGGFGTKPLGGLWASPITEDGKSAWWHWCKEEEYQVKRLKQHFDFRLRNGSKIKTLITKEDLDDCPKTDTPQYSINDKAVYLDFEELVKQEFDAIYHESGCLYWELYGWDCDCLLVLNPDVIEVV